jgi:hypothetical protein
MISARTSNVIFELVFWTIGLATLLVIIAFML